MLLALPISLCDVVALIFQGVARFICPLPAGSAASHALIDRALAHPSGCHPTKGLDCISAHFPGLDAIDPPPVCAAVRGTSLTQRNRWTPPAARSWRSYEVPCPACAAPWPCWNR